MGCYESILRTISDKINLQTLLIVLFVFMCPFHNKGTFMTKETKHLRFTTHDSQFTKIIVCGAKGKMGQMIADLIRNDDNLELLAGIDIGDNLEDKVQDCDVVIDFSSTNASVNHTKICAKHKKPIVIGTTGFDEEQNKQIQDISKETAILKSSNMSLGVNIFWQVAKTLSERLPWKVSISETHHIHKKDRPSGTALTLAEHVQGNKKLVFFEENFPEKNQPEDELWICSIRENEVVGDHDLILRTDDEEITISHRAFDRKIFAKGAVQAARWIIKKPAGMYQLADSV